MNIYQSIREQAYESVVEGANRLGVSVEEYAGWRSGNPPEAVEVVERAMLYQRNAPSVAPLKSQPSLEIADIPKEPECLKAS